jgi:hypothetical protein
METTMSIPRNVRITYVRDIDNQDRVLTLAHRRNDDNTVSFGISINRPTQWVPEYQNKNNLSLYKVHGDKFNKKLGREIALGRLACDRSATTIEIPADTSPLLACLLHLSAASEHRHIKRIAKCEADFLLWEDLCLRNAADEYLRESRTDDEQ